MIVWHHSLRSCPSGEGIFYFDAKDSDMIHRKVHEATQELAHPRTKKVNNVEKEVSDLIIDWTFDWLMEWLTDLEWLMFNWHFDWLPLPTMMMIMMIMMTLLLPEINECSTSPNIRQVANPMLQHSSSQDLRHLPSSGIWHSKTSSIWHTSRTRFEGDKLIQKVAKQRKIQYIQTQQCLWNYFVSCWQWLLSW